MPIEASAPTPPLANLACPLCGQANGCVPAQCGRFDVACWCRDANFSAELLARVPTAQQGVACICAQCAGPGRPAITAAG